MSPTPPTSKVIPGFKHIPLQADGSTFRIVYLHPGDLNDQIECEFLEVPTFAEPNYSALSYTWGKPDVTAYVNCHGCNISIGGNLENAMRRIRDPDNIRAFWIDALCIDQNDEADEKSTQIPLMRRIYQRAPKVIIYLGEEYEGSEQIPTLCKNVLQAFGTIHNPVLSSSISLNSSAQWRSLSGNRILPKDYQKHGLPMPGSAEWKIFPRFICRPWFSRVWILQEVILSTSADIIFPDEVLNGGLSVNNYEGPMRSFVQIFFMEALGASKPDFVRWKCIDLFYLGRLALASLPHDYCYGLLGLSEELDHPDLRVDYTLSVEEVYCQFAKYFVRNGDGVKLLFNAANEQNLDLPSWVPDWSYRFVKQARVAPDPNSVSDEAAHSAASAYLSSIKLHPILPDVLIVRGIFVDVIELIGECHLSSIIANTNQSEVIQEAMISYSSPINERDLRAVSDCVVEISHLVRDDPSPAYPAEHEESIIWKTLICNTGAKFIRTEGLEDVVVYRFFLLLLMSTVGGLKGGLFLRALYDHCYDRRRGRTARGYIGQFSHHAQVGDIIFLPLGSAVPFSIRPKVNGTYRLVGECYLHGLMSGEAFFLKPYREESIEVS
ncbi:heterokaryon incompatibility protein-domain-containing protein [Dendryphion nanum]|uniref:Heterokaryon incompatibility protein-domain-containing protein n=1 Tax=Dendryphion nanum TaxID=256645 RepID=A0A9P9E6Z1_9PLEO|nr:heterokaryon incompatibility protein-domain-containing protein [Dendryphion nanum]